MSWIWPATTHDITQGFSEAHRGIDIAAPAGTPVIAPVGGKIERAGFDPDGYGNLVVIDTPDRLRVLLAHLQTIGAKINTTIQPGEVIGTIGSTGNSTGYHLHLEVRDQGDRPVSPDRYFSTPDTLAAPALNAGPPGMAGSKVASAQGLTGSTSGAAGQAAGAGLKLLDLPTGAVSLPLGWTGAAIGFMALGSALMLVGLVGLISDVTRPAREQAAETGRAVAPVAVGAAAGPVAGAAVGAATAKTGAARAAYAKKAATGLLAKPTGKKGTK